MSLEKITNNLAAFIKTITKLRCANEPEEAANVLSEWAKEQGKSPLILVDEAERFFENFPPRFFERLRVYIINGKVAITHEKVWYLTTN